MGSITALVDQNGNIAQSYRYDSFGNILSSTGSLTQPYTYTGREYDSETGLYYYRARYYDPKIGRFLQQDPIFDENLYSYCANNPLNYVDPFGLRHGGRGNGQVEWRLPDYISLNINVTIYTPWTGTLFGITPIAISLDRYGNWYYGLGPNVGKTATFVSGSLTGGWLKQCGKPTQNQLNNFLTAHGVNIGGGYWGGAGKQWSPGNGTATNVGIFSPQFGAGYTYSWQIGHWNISW